jgi:hypothetical protein
MMLYGFGKVAAPVLVVFAVHPLLERAAVELVSGIPVHADGFV